MAAKDGERKAGRFRDAAYAPWVDHLGLISRDAKLTKFQSENYLCPAVPGPPLAALCRSNGLKRAALTSVAGLGALSDSGEDQKPIVGRLAILNAITFCASISPPLKLSVDGQNRRPDALAN
jgi:hypothetical protein